MISCEFVFGMFFKVVDAVSNLDASSTVKTKEGGKKVVLEKPGKPAKGKFTYCCVLQ